MEIKHLGDLGHVDVAPESHDHQGIASIIDVLRRETEVDEFLDLPNQISDRDKQRAELRIRSRHFLFAIMYANICCSEDFTAFMHEGMPNTELSKHLYLTCYSSPLRLRIRTNEKTHDIEQKCS